MLKTQMRNVSCTELSVRHGILLILNIKTKLRRLRLSSKSIPTLTIESRASLCLDRRVRSFSPMTRMEIKWTWHLMIVIESLSLPLTRATPTDSHLLTTILARASAKRQWIKWGQPIRRRMKIKLLHQEISNLKRNLSRSHRISCSRRLSRGRHISQTLWRESMSCQK